MPRDSMWWEMWKNLQNILETKQGQLSQRKWMLSSDTLLAYDYKGSVFPTVVSWKRVVRVLL